MTSPELSHEPADSYLAERLIGQFEADRDSGNTTLHNLLQYLQQLKTIPGFDRAWEGVIAHGRKMYEGEQPFDINAYLCGALVGLRTVDATEALGFMEKMDEFNVNRCRSIGGMYLMPITKLTEAEASSGWHECAKVSIESKAADDALGQTLTGCKLNTGGEIGQFKMGMGWIVAAHQACYRELYVSRNIDEELKRLLDNQP